MFGFLNSTVLLAAAASLVPLLIHLFFRRRVKVVEFSSLKHLKAMQRRQVRRLKIRQWLLLLLRMLIILMVVLAFARPTSTGGSVGAHATVSAVVLMDNSASMNRQTADGDLFEIARRQTERLLATFGETDEVALVPLCRSKLSAPILRLGSPATAAQQLRDLPAGHGRADLEGGLATAASVLTDAGNLNKEIYIVCDRQRGSLPDSQVLTSIDAHVYIVDLPLEGHANCGITDVAFGGQLLVPGQDFDLTATVRNYGADNRSDIIASLFINDQRVAQVDLAVAAGQETTARFTRSLSRGGFHSGYVELSDDRFAGDNRYYFSFRIPPTFNVLIIDGDGTGQLLGLALVPSASANRYWSVKRAGLQELSQVSFSDYDVIILAGSPTLPASYANRIKSFVKNGKSLLLTYGDRTDIDYFNRVWSEVSGVVFDEPIRQDFTRAGYYTFHTFDLNHPIFTVFGFEKEPPPEIKFFTLPKAHTIGQARTVAGFTGGRPAMVQADFSQGRVVTFIAPLAPEYTDLAARAFFVPLVARTVEYLSSDLSSYDVHLFTDDHIRRNLIVKGAVGAVYELTAPDGRVFSIPPEEQQGVLVLSPEPTDLPGIYRISSLSYEVDRFAVNLDPDEGDLTAADVDQFATALGARNYRLLDAGENVAAAIAQLRFGKELWPLFLWTAIMLLAAEMLLSRAAGAGE